MVQCHINNAIAISPRRRMCPHKKSSHTCTLSLPHMDAGRLIQSIPLISSPSEKPEKAQFVDTSNQRLLHHCQCQMEYIYIYISVHFLIFIIVIVIFIFITVIVIFIFIMITITNITMIIIRKSPKSPLHCRLIDLQD